MKFRPILIAAILASVPASAWAVPNPQAGEELALQSCTMCHAPTAGQQAGKTAPSLSELAKKHGQNWAQSWMSDPHHKMADLKLSRPQIADVVAYLKLIPTA